MKSTAIRVQVAIYNILQAEFIAEDYSTADELLAAYWRRRHAKGLEMGGACIAHVSRPRQWDVPVGSVIPSVGE